MLARDPSSSSPYLSGLLGLSSLTPLVSWSYPVAFDRLIEISIPSNNTTVLMMADFFLI